MPRAVFALLLGAFLSTPTPGQADPPIWVGEFGDLKQLQIRGSESFTEDEIRQGLQWDLALLPATRSSARFTDFCDVLGIELTNAYRCRGFSDVIVSVRWDEESQSPLATIEEGPRYRCAQVVIDGVDDQVKQSIRNWVTKPHPPLDAIYGRSKFDADLTEWTSISGQPAELQDPVWEAGQHVNFLEMYPHVVRALVTRALQDHGYFSSQFQIRIEPNQAEQTATLNITATDPGPVAVVDRIVISGNQRDPAEEILRRAGIHEGDSCTAETLLKAQQRLRNSGRFRWSSVTLATQLIPTDPVEVVIELAEYDPAPPLAEELGDIDRVACRTAEWLTHLPKHGYDLIMSFSSQGRDSSDEVELEYQTVVAVSPKSGFLVRFTGPDFLRGGKESLLFAMSQGTVDLVLDRSRQRFHLPLSEGASIFCSFELDGLKESDNGSQINFRYGAGINSHEVSKPQSMIVSPMAMMYLFNRSKDTQLTDEFLTLSGPSMFGRVEVATGRPLELKDSSEQDGAISSFIVRTERSGLNQLRREWLDSVPITSDGSKRPVAAFGDFLVQAIDDRHIDDPIQARRRVAFSKLIVGVIGRIDALIRKHVSDINSSAMLIGTHRGLQNSLLGSLFAHALPIQDILFARDTRPWKFGRELAAYVVLNDQSARFELNKLMESPDTGPLTHLYMAACVAHLVPPVAESLAKQGLHRLETIYLRKDLDEWLNEDGFLGELVIECARELRTLSEDEIAALFHGLPEAEFRDLKSVLADDKVSDSEITMRTIEFLWNHGGGRELISDALSRFARMNLPETAAK